MKNEVKLFESQHVRSLWDEENQKWWFSIIDVVAVLTEQVDQLKARKYWNQLRKRLSDEGSETVTNRHQLRMPAKDGKLRLTDVADTKQLLRIIQSVPSKKAEPFKLWLAEVGSDRIDEAENPELTIERAMREYRALGYDEQWINTRMQSIHFRKELTDEWKRSGVSEGIQFGILTNILTQGWSGMDTKAYKEFKGLKKQNLRDNMSSVELALNILAEATTTEISKTKNPQGFSESKEVAKEGGKVALNARKDIEERTGQSAITSDNAKDLKRLNMPE